MDQLLQGQSGTLNVFWEQNGDDVDPGPVTVTVTRDDGTVLVASAPASGASPSPDRTYILTPVQTASLDRLTAVWTSSVDGSSVTTYAEISGGFHFSVRQARLRSPLQDLSAYPTDQIVYYRALAEHSLEDICGVAFVPRYSRHSASISTAGMLAVPRRRIRIVRQVTTFNGTTQQSLSNLTGVRLLKGGGIWLPTLWNVFALPVYVAYEHGYDETPFRVSRASLELARRWLVESPWDERMTAYRDRAGGEIDILTASHSNPFDIPEVVAVAEQYGLPMIGVL